MNKYEVNSLAVYGDYDCFHCTVVNVFPVELEKPVIKIYCPDCEKVVYAPKLKTGQAVFHCPHCRSPLPIDSTGEFGPRYHYIIEAIRGYSLNNKSIFLHFFARTPHISFSKGDYLFVTGTLCYIEEGNKIQDVLLLGSFEKKSNRLNELIVFEEITSENFRFQFMKKTKPLYTINSKYLFVKQNPKIYLGFKEN